MTTGNSSFKDLPILVVGTGGIGCELLKTLALSGYTNIQVVDLDVIELSNLNRQFLFRKHHIGKPKCEVAAEAVMKMSPKTTVVPHWANIKNIQLFPLSFFASFSLVMNALDNLDARQYVNNMCLTVKVPLIESGTAGYLGQTSVILPDGKSECFDCTPKEKPKVFPVCTIRATPSAPIHCVVWAKDYLLPNLFGDSLEEANYPQDADESLIASLKNEVEAVKLFRNMAASNEPDLAAKIFEKIFNTDIQQLLSLKDLWSDGKTKPSPLEYSPPSEDSLNIISQLDNHKIWILQDWIALFVHSIDLLRSRAYSSTNTPAAQYFDKDDEVTMNFVAAASNLRAQIFSIPLQSLFTLKSMAGNIIPAIATTNAIVAGLMVLQATNLMEKRVEACCNCFLTYGVKRRSLFAKELLNEPNPSCAVCHVDRALIKVDPSTTTLLQLIQTILDAYPPAKEAGIDHTDVMVLEGSRILYDEDMGDANLNRKLVDIQFVDSTFIKFDFISLEIPLLIAIDATSNGNTGEVQFQMIPEHLRSIPRDEQEEREEVAEPVTKKSKTMLSDEQTVVEIDDIL